MAPTSTEFKYETPLKPNHFEQPVCTIYKSREYGERWMAHNYTRPNACVLEFGAGVGSVTATLQEKLSDPTCHVAVEPGAENTSGLDLSQLRDNIAACDHKVTVVDHVLAKGEELSSLVSGRPFDTLVVDCEGCLVHEHKKNPHLFEHVTQVQVERDDNGKYDKLFKEMGLTRVFREKTGRADKCFNEVWEKA